VYNVYALNHLSAYVKCYGHLDAFSAVPFENQLHTLKRLVRKASMPLLKTVRRVLERCQFTLPVSSLLNENSSVYAAHLTDPKTDDNKLAQQVMQFHNQGFFLSLSDVDNCIALS
jgi:hypothetical protein